jgi:hypothetical protein
MDTNKRILKGSINHTIGRTIHAFHEAILNYFSNKSSVESALNVIETGSDFLRSVKSWWNDTKGVNSG